MMPILLDRGHPGPEMRETAETLLAQVASRPGRMRR